MPVETPAGEVVALSQDELDAAATNYMRMLAAKAPPANAGVVIRADVLVYLFRCRMGWRLLADVLEGGIALVKERWPQGSFVPLLGIEYIRTIVDKVDDLRGGTPDLSAEVRPKLDLGFLQRPVPEGPPDRVQVQALGRLATEVQPAPTNETGDVWAEIIPQEEDPAVQELMVARRDHGIKKYGRPLGRDNSRDHKADAAQEALDGMVYAWAAGNMSAVAAFREALRALITPAE